MMINDQLDSRYAAGGGQPAEGSGGTATSKEAKAAEVAAAITSSAGSEEGGDGAGTEVFKKKKSSKSKKKNKEKEGGGNGSGGASEEGSQVGDPPDAHNVRHATSPTSGASVASHGRSVHSSSIRSRDPDGDSNTATIGEVWEVSRPPGLVRDGGSDFGHFYISAPATNDAAHFKAFLNNQKYATRSVPCVDWRGWMENNPHATLIHMSDVPRDAFEKGRHLLEVRPGSAFFSRTQLSIKDDFDGFEETWEDSGSYAQMMVLHPSARGMDADESLPGRFSDPNSEQAFRDYRQGRSQSGGSGRGGGHPPVVRENPDQVSFLRKGFTQNIIAGIVAFTGPGLFNAMQGLGNAGGSDPKVAATMNAVLYATFSIFGVLSGSLFNLLGTKLLMSFGALTYGFYAISVYLWGQVSDSYAPMAIVASAILGLGAACLWGAQGTMTLSYALEKEKGLYFGIFWLIFNMGGVMGGFITFGVNSGPEEERSSSVTPETYFTFCGLMAAGAVFAFFFVIKPGSVVKADGSPVVFEQTDTAEGIGELREVAKLFTNRYMLLLTPLIIQSNWFYAYEFGGINGLLFDAPTRGLNSAVYWAISGVSSYVCGTYYLDRESLGGRRQRAIKGLVMISAINVGQWVYAIIYQFSTGYDKGNAPDPPINFRDGGAYAAPMILFMYCGLADSLVQTYAYWIIGAISNSPKTLSRYVGYYKGIQSFGACLAWIIEAEGASYRAQVMICATLAVIFIPPTYMVATSVSDMGSVTQGGNSNSASLSKDRHNENVRYTEGRSYNNTNQEMI